MQGFTLAVTADYSVEGIGANCLIVGPVTPLVTKLGAEAPERCGRAVPLRTEGMGWDVALASV